MVHAANMVPLSSELEKLISKSRITVCFVINSNQKDISAESGDKPSASTGEGSASARSSKSNNNRNKAVA